MAYKSGPVTLGTGDTDIFVCPATYEAAVKINVANITATPRALTLKLYKASTGLTTTIVAGAVIAAVSFPNNSLSFPFTMEAGDKIIGSSPAAASALVVTPAISLSPSTAAKGLTPRGVYSAGTTYAKNDVAVVPDEASYISMVDGNIGNQPSSNAAQWMVFGQRGEIGAAGVAGASSLAVVRVVSTGSASYATDFENGDTIDGVVLATNDLVLRASVTDPERNGVYIVQSSGAASRHSDFDAYDEYPGRYISVQEGTAGADTLWQCTSNAGGTLNTTAITFANSLKLATIELGAQSDTTLSRPAPGRIQVEGEEVISTKALTLTPVQQAAVRGSIGASPLIHGDVLCPHHGLVVKYISDTTLDIDAIALVLFDSDGNSRRFAAIDLTADITTSGANGLDTGSEGSSRWYHIWGIAKADGTVAGLLSESASSPTLPAGYAYKGYLGAVYNNGSSNFVTFYQRSRFVICASTAALAAGTQTSYTAIDLSALVPPTATFVGGAQTIATTSGTATITGSLASAGSGTTPTYGGACNVLSSVSVNGLQQSARVLLTTPQQVVYFMSGTNGTTSFAVRNWEY